MAGKTKGLGRGLGTLFGDAADMTNPAEAVALTEEDKKNETMVKIRMIEPNRNQPRKNFDENALNELAESIKAYGVIQPLIVVKRDKHYEIIAGERRWRAAKIAGLKEVPVVVKDYTPEEIAEIALIENIQREDLNPVEEAKAYRSLIEEYRFTQEELAEKLSKSRTAITNSMRILKLSDKTLELVESGKLSTGHAKVLLSLENTEDQDQAAATAAEKQLSVRETEKLVKNWGSGKEKKKTNRKPKESEQIRVQYDLQKNLLETILETKVRFNRKSESSGQIVIDYYSIDDIERILAHIK